MTYTASSQGAQANCASVFAASLDTLLLAAGFTAVETWTSAAKTAMIYKSAAAGNTFGADWYFSVYRTADNATGLSFSVGEVWDTGTHKFRNYAPTVTTMTPTGLFAVNDATGLLPDASTLFKASITISAAGFSWWVSANPNRVVIADRVGASDSAVYFGLYDDLLPVALSPFPLCSTTLAGAGNSGSFTREPGATTSTASAFGLNVGSSTQWSPMMATSVDLYQGKYIPARAAIWSTRAGGQATASGLRGLLKSVVYCAIPSAVNGDTLAVTDSVGTVVNYVKLAGASDYWCDVAA